MRHVTRLKKEKLKKKTLQNSHDLVWAQSITLRISEQCEIRVKFSWKFYSDFFSLRFTQDFVKNQKSCDKNPSKILFFPKILCFPWNLFKRIVNFYCQNMEFSSVSSVYTIFLAFSRILWIFSKILKISPKFVTGYLKPNVSIQHRVKVA